MPTRKALTIEQLKHALHLAGEVARIEAEIHVILGTDGSDAKLSPPTAEKDPRKVKRSSAVRAKMAAAQRARWAKSKGETSTPVVQNPKKKGKRTMSPEAKAKIAAAQKARWARSKSAKAPTGAVIEKIAKIEAAAPKAKKKAKRNISPEGRAKMVEAGKRRWAKQAQAA